MEEEEYLKAFMSDGESKDELSKDSFFYTDDSDEEFEEQMYSPDDFSVEEED